MKKYLKTHTELIKKLLLEEKESCDWKGLIEYNKTRISFMQHERLIHLLVTLFFALFLFISIGLALSYPRLEFAILTALFFIMTAAYIVHYFTLENGVQKLYRLHDEIEQKIKTVWTKKII